MGLADLSAGVLFVGLLISTIGVGIFVYGKKQRRWPQLVAGLVLVTFPYFIPAVWPMLGIGTGVIAVLWWGVRAGF